MYHMRQWWIDYQIFSGRKGPDVFLSSYMGKKKQRRSPYSLKQRKYAEQKAN